MAPLLGLPQFLADHGLDADAEIREVGCDPALFENPENTIEFAAVGRLLVHASRVTECPCTGLALCRHYGLDVLGALGRAIRLAPDVGAALRALILYLHLHDRGAIPFLWEGERQAIFGYTIYCPGVPGTNQIYDGAIAIGLNIITELAGKDWRATEVRLYRQKPKDIGPYRQHFQASLRFGSEHAAIVFPAIDLARPLVGADPIAYATALRDLESMDVANGAGLAIMARRLLRGLLIGEHGPAGITLVEVARLFALHPRTLDRRLRAEGTTFSTLLAETRFEIARQLLRDTSLQTADIALALGYSGSASFNHAFRRWSGTNTTAWRSLHKAI